MDASAAAASSSLARAAARSDRTCAMSASRRSHWAVAADTFDSKASCTNQTVQHTPRSASTRTSHHAVSISNIPLLPKRAPCDRSVTTHDCRLLDSVDGIDLCKLDLGRSNLVLKARDLQRVILLTRQQTTRKPSSRTHDASCHAAVIAPTLVTPTLVTPTLVTPTLVTPILVTPTRASGAAPLPTFTSISRFYNAARVVSKLAIAVFSSACKPGLQSSTQWATAGPSNQMIGRNDCTTLT